MKTREEMSREEMTRDPIFLLQVRGDKRQKWQTETVFLTREEGEAWAKRREYRWGEWQIYCIPCEGALAALLRGLDEPEMQNRKVYDLVACIALVGDLEK